MISIRSRFNSRTPSNPRRARVGRRVIFRLNRFLILSLLMASLRNASGDSVNAQMAEIVVRGWLRATPCPLQTTMGQQVKRVVTFHDAQDTPLYHVIDLEPDGFVIVAANDLVEPIVGFAPCGQFDPSPDNPLGALVSRDLPERIAEVKSKAASKAHGLFRAARNKWEQLKGIEQVPAGVQLGLVSVSDVRVAPLTQTQWDQSTVSGNACYNYYTPPYAAGTASNYYCGCVATALAQIMRYWQYPSHDVVTDSFVIKVNGAEQSRTLFGGDGAGHPYVWSNMVLEPSSSTTLEQRQAIGTLCHDAGVAVNMDYGATGSAADTLKASDALVDTFGYANAVKGYCAGAPIGSGLNGMINPNLDAGCPVLLGITGSSGGHAIVCDGYGYNLSTLYHHLNLGWSGSYTAWYNLPIIDPGSYTFTSVYKCVYNIWTNGTGEIVSGRVTDGVGAPLTGVVVTAASSNGKTCTTTSDLCGIYALAKIPSDSSFTVTVHKAGYLFTNRIITTGQSTDYTSISGNRWAVDFTSVGTAPTVTLSLTGSPMAEAGGKATVTATLSATSALPVTVNLSFGGTAIWTNDYSRSGTNIVIAAGSLSGSITLTAVSDALYEGNKIIAVSIGGVVNGTISDSHLVTASILDDDRTLTIRSDWGTSSPKTGIWTFAYGTQITNTMTSPDVHSTTQYACMGWVMTGNEPANGSTTNFTMFLTNNTTLRWNWRTQYLLRVSAANGTLNVTNEWIERGSDVLISTIPLPFYHFVSWTGETNGCAMNSNTIEAVMSMPRTLHANCSADLATNETPTWWLNSHRLTNRDWNVETLDDQDRDGFMTWKEWIADTDPTNAQSFLQMTEMVVDDEQIRVDWRGGQQALQKLQYHPNLVDTGIEWTIIYTNPPPTEISNSITITIATNRGFFRTKVER